VAGRYWFVLVVSGCADLAGIGAPAPLEVDAPEIPCVVGGLDLCLFSPPQAPLTVDVDFSVDTSRDCNLVVYAPPAPSVCVIYASEIHVSATLSASGSRALVLAATGLIEITGDVDVSSYRALGNVGAGADNASCEYNAAGAYGGTAGGSFAGKGGNGGNGVGGNGTANLGAIATSAITIPETVRGGCRGGAGGAHSGGAVWFASASEIRVQSSGHVLANGAGGRGGLGGFGEGTGGGGSGGMIRLAAPHLVIAGLLTANGGGGAEGIDGEGNNMSASGTDGTAGTSRAPGGAGMSANGGDGGDGGAGTSPDGTIGGNGTGTTSTGGGGGGGAGFVQLLGETIENTATISPSS
jgi:hypothetical protein